MSTGKCYDCGKAERLHGCVRCADCHGQWLTDYMSFTQPGKKESYCGLKPIITGENDPFYQIGACKNHDEDFDRWIAGEKVKGGLVGVSARWVKDTTKTFITSLWGVVGFPFYLVGGLVGGAVRWRQVRPRIKQDPPSGSDML